MLNLFTNAAKADPGGAVTVAFDPGPDTVGVTVRDRGCGIPADQLDRITEPFYMVDKSRARKQGGSGLGLALCARIAEAHGTALTFASAPGQGTAVRFVLRRARPAAPEKEEPHA
ncbi:MAG: sensor histidine kinase [Gemmiger sp.]